MNITAIVFLGVGLAMDAFAVSVTSGMVIKKLMLRNILKIGLFFGFFQALMPLLGWLIGSYTKNLIVSFDHWIAFAILSLIGIKMIYESTKPGEEKKQNDPLQNKVLLMLAIATSIDALAAGLSLALLEVSIILAIIIVGLITFVLSSFGVVIGKRFGGIFNKKAGLIGGIFLILIGIKTLLEHTNIISVL